MTDAEIETGLIVGGALLAVYVVYQISEAAKAAAKKASTLAANLTGNQSPEEKAATADAVVKQSASGVVSSGGGVFKALNVLAGVDAELCAEARALNDWGGILAHCSTSEVLQPSINVDPAAAAFWQRNPTGVFYGD